MIIRLFLGLLEEIFITIFVNIGFRLPVACIQWAIAQIKGENKTFKEFYKRKIVIYYIPQALTILAISLIFGLIIIFVLFGLNLMWFYNS